VVELDFWYDQEPANDFSEGDPAIVVRTAAELDALINRVLEESKDHRVGAMVQVNIHGQTGYPALEVGLAKDTGFIFYHAEDGGSTKGDGNPDDVVEYVYAGNLTEVPADVEVPIQQVRRGLQEFLATGARPSVVK
jgi:hypothetical protein